jgi:hypothetical protein
MLACCVQASAAAQAPEYVIVGNDDSLVRFSYRSSTIRLCHTSDTTTFLRITTPAMGHTWIDIHGGLICKPEEVADVVLSASKCEILSGTLAVPPDETCDNK